MYIRDASKCKRRRQDDFQSFFPDILWGSEVQRIKKVPILITSYLKISIQKFYDKLNKMSFKKHNESYKSPTKSPTRSKGCNLLVANNFCLAIIPIIPILRPINKELA